MDTNEIHLTGTIEKFDRIPTKTGLPMIKVLLRSYKEGVSIVAFRDVAEQTTLAPGDRAEVRGRIQSTSWTGTDGAKRYGYQVVADSITLLGSETPPAQEAPPPVKASPTRNPTGRDSFPMAGPTDFF